MPVVAGGGSLPTLPFLPVPEPRVAPLPRIPPPIAPATQVAAIVGLDFGTFSTKTLLRQRGEDSAEVVQIEDPVDGYPAFASPSLVRLIQGRLYFGREAVGSREGNGYRSLKVRLLRPAGSSHASASPTPATDGDNPELLTAAYLCWVLGRVRAVVEERLGLDRTRIFLNVAAPMNHREESELKTRYLRIVQAAWDATFGSRPFPVEQGARLTDVENRFLPLLAPGTAVPDESVRPYDVLPETVASIVSLGLNPRTDPGMYMIVDMGAGTTEISINHVSGGKITCYEDDSFELGGDNFEWAEGVKQPPVERARVIGQLVDTLVKRFRRTWRSGFFKDAPNPATHGRWRELRVLLAGGGTLRPDVQAAIQGGMPIHAWPREETMYSVARHKPEGIRPRKGRGSVPPLDRSLLSVAHGLSLHRRQWPLYFMPDQVDTQAPAEVIERLPANWYQER